MIWKSLDRFRDFGLLLLRLGLGGMFIVVHGGPKLAGGPERWERVGEAMRSFGVDFLPMMWGFTAGALEFVGGILLVLGLYFRLAIVMIVPVMVVAARSQWLDPAGTPYWPIEIGIVLIALFFIGPGRFALDERGNRRPTLHF